MPYRFAIAGCGNIANRHANLAVANGKLCAVCDIDINRAESLASRFGARPYHSLTALLQHEQPDVVVICTPNGLHAVQAIEALEAGSHVLCEKPMAITVADCKIMIRAASVAGRRLFVVKQNRYNPPVRLLKNLVEEGKLGRITGFQINGFWNRSRDYYRSAWRGTLALDGGTLFTQFSHFIDILHWILGEMDQVSGLRANYLHQDCVEFEDMGTANISMKNGAIGNIFYTINAHGSNMEGSLSVFGDKGSVKIGGEYLNKIDFFSVANEQLPPLEPSAPANTYSQYTGSMSNHHIVYKEMLRSLEEPAHVLVEAEEAMKSVEMIARIYEASPMVKTLKDEQ